MSGEEEKINHTVTYQPTISKADRFILEFTKMCVGDPHNEYNIIKILNLLEDRRFQVFLDVLDDLDIQTGFDFSDFMCVIQEHCFENGITDYSTIRSVWRSHQESLQDVVESIKEHTDADN